jgi:hypothetical protein
MSTLDYYLDRKSTVLAQRRADFTAAPEKATVRIQAKSWVAGNTGARPVRLGEMLFIVEIEVCGAVPMGGVVGLPYDKLPQMEQISYTANVITSAPAEELERMHQAVEESCPVLNTVRRPTAVTRQPVNTVQ